MKIVAGCPVAERAWVLQAWLDALRAQKLDDDVELDITCLYTESVDATLEILERNDVNVIRSAAPTRAIDRMATHAWSYVDHEYEYMATLRNELTSYVLNSGANLFLSIDSDVLFRTTRSLQSMVTVLREHNADAVAPLVNMEALPNHEPAWNFMEMRFDRTGADRTPGFNIKCPPFKTDVIMAAMLLTQRAMMVPWRNHPQGEDIGWSIKAYHEGLSLFVDPSVKCDHIMRYGGNRGVV